MQQIMHKMKIQPRERSLYKVLLRDKREEHFAKKIQEVSKLYPTHSIIGVFGESHIESIEAFLNREL